MEAEFWLQRWVENRIGFHQGTVNAFLEQYWERLDTTTDGEVFVPLCGKTLDMLWLAGRARVVGVELSPRAVQDFFAENALPATTREDGPFAISESPDIRLYCGDFFALQPAQLAAVRTVYDRAALIALPREMRIDYARHLTRVLPQAVQILLVTLDYEQTQMNGPPFAVSEAEVHALFEPDWSVDKLDEIDVLAHEPKFRERGLSRMSEQVYLLNKQ